MTGSHRNSPASGPLRMRRSSVRQRKENSPIWPKPRRRRKRQAGSWQAVSPLSDSIPRHTLQRRRQLRISNRCRYGTTSSPGRLAQAGEVQAQLAATRTRIAENAAAQKEADATLATHPFDPQQGPVLDAELAQVIAAQRETDAGLARAAEHLKHAEEKIAEIKRDQAKVTGLEARIAAGTEEIELLKLTRSVIADYVIYLMQVVRSRIEGEVSRIVSEITGGRYERVLLDEDFNLLIRDVDDDYAIDRFSGGEQDDIAVALRIALSRYLAELHNVHESTLLIFDEIFGSQDEERRNNLLTALRTQESRFPQILLISHIPEMQGEFATTLIVEMGTDLSSRVKAVE